MLFKAIFNKVILWFIAIFKVSGSLRLSFTRKDVKVVPFIEIIAVHSINLQHSLRLLGLVLLLASFISTLMANSDKFSNPARSMNKSHFSVFDDEIVVAHQKRDQREKQRTEIFQEQTINGTRHETVIKSGSAYRPIPHEPLCTAKKYPFELDTFQRISIAAIERDESVLVSAHTSCGKTVVAEYAIAQSLLSHQRVIYTSPIKALSNQKYRELQEEFKDVGLMTGDVTINPTASCLVMTTEILRNMLYRGSEVIREAHWVIFDEIHYMRDKERGVVWEEAIIMLPNHVRMVFLSATIPNAREFAEWICFLSENPIHVVYTERRIIPLEHYFYTDALYLVKAEKFNSKAIADSGRKTVKKQEIAGKLNEMIGGMSLPAVVFSFSRKDCESYALKIRADLLNPDEKKMVRTIFSNAIASLREEDRRLQIIENMLPLLLRGVGIHHSGLLPILREIIEILFQESLIKLLFATETFSIGLNMPAKTVLFTSLRKFDGTTRRLLTSGEYIQMSGRAGRRGLDDKGIVISILTEALTTEQIKSMFSASSDALFSAFRLTYNMILSLMRIEGMDPIFILSRSFFHFQAYKRVLLKEEQLYFRLENTTRQACSPEQEEIVKLLKRREMLVLQRNKELVQKLYLEIGKKGRIVDVFIPRSGAPLLIKNAIVRLIKDKTGERTTEPSTNDKLISLYVLTNKDIEVREYPLEWITSVYDIRCKPDMKVFSRRFKRIEHESEFNEEINQIENKLYKEIPSLDLDTCMFCKSPSRACLVNCEFRTGNITEFGDGIARQVFEDAANTRLNSEIDELERLKGIYHMDEFKNMVKVLKELEYIDEHSVLIKGKMASEISTGDELVLTEMIFNSSFSQLPLRDMVALLSCVVCEENSDDNFVLSDENQKVFRIMKGAVDKVCRVMQQCGLEINQEEYFGRFSCEMMDVVKMWMSGYTFGSICESTPIFEGTIIRVFKRLEELMRQLSDGAQVIGNGELADLFGQGIFLIKRDIVFANSLYL